MQILMLNYKLHFFLSLIHHSRQKSEKPAMWAMFHPTSRIHFRLAAKAISSSTNKKEKFADWKQLRHPDASWRKSELVVAEDERRRRRREPRVHLTR